MTAHILAKIFHLNADGFSTIYQYFIYVSGVFYGISGLYNLYILLKKNTENKIAIITILSLLFATNLFYYLFIENGMGHIYSFFLISAILVQYNRFLSNATYRNTALIGISVGLLFLIRPTNIIVLPFILFSFSVLNLSSIKQRILYLSKHYKQIVLAIIISSIPFVLQMIYWKYATGLYFFNAYRFMGLGFDFLHPKLYYGLFDTNRGLFFYSPILILFIIGLFVKRKYNIVSSINILLYFLFNVWIVYSWKVYDYGGSYGARALVESFVILAIPLSSAIAFLTKNTYSKFFLFGVLIVLSSLNLFQVYKFTMRYTIGYSHLEMQHSYFHTGNYHCNAPKKIETVSQVKELKFDNNYILNNNTIFSPSIEILFDTLKNKSNKIIAIEAAGKYPAINILYGKHNAQLVMALVHNGEIYNWKSNDFVSNTPTGDTTINVVRAYMTIPTPLDKNDNIKFFVWNPGKNDFELKRLKVELLKIKTPPSSLAPE